MCAESLTSDQEVGFEEGSKCNRLGCSGVIAIHPAENCSCHIAPPCSACTDPRAYCSLCDWQEKDDEIHNDFVVNVNRETGVYRTWTPRPLDSSKVDWHSKPHSNSSMIKEGVYPNSASKAEVEALVKGTFGGRFEHFGNGRFKYVAYTD